jgi:hypothetical protein
LFGLCSDKLNTAAFKGVFAELVNWAGGVAEDPRQKVRLQVGTKLELPVATDVGSLSFVTLLAFLEGLAIRRELGLPALKKITFEELSIKENLISIRTYY